MSLRIESIEERLLELEKVLQELNKHQTATVASISTDLSQRWILERGLIAAASLIFDIADHILAGHMGVRPSNQKI
jgi:uncharacterized protein YutE (UPF0331/DUF86 family)